MGRGYPISDHGGRRVGFEALDRLEPLPLLHVRVKAEQRDLEHLEDRRHPPDAVDRVDKD